MRLILTLAALLCAASACSEPSEEQSVMPAGGPGNYAPEHAPGGVAITAIGDLVGEYRVAGLNDRELGDDVGVALSIDGAMMSFEPTCAGFVWDVGFDGERLNLQRQRESAPMVAEGEIPPPPRPVCAVAFPTDYSALATALDAATRAERLQGNAIRLSGGGQSVTLFSQ